MNIASPAATQVIHVLYAEDNPMDADLTRSRFADEGPDFALEVAGTGAACLNRVSEGNFDILLLDHHLPDMDGLDVLRQLAAKGSSLPVVIVTGAGHDELVVQALRAGASDYVAKTGDHLATLPGIIRGLVGQHRQRKQIGQVITGTLRRVLYVEPNVMDRDLTATHFAAHAPHLKLTAVTNCIEALERVAQPNDFDLVLTDLRIPGMSALEFLHEARHRGIELPFIIITGRGDEETAVATLRLGAYDYMVKRENYLTQLTYSIDNAIHRFQLDQTSKRLHRELAELNQSLEQKVHDRTAALEQENAERQRAEAALRESEERFRQLADHLPAVFWLTSPDYTHVFYVSPAFETIWGRTCNSLYESPNVWMEPIHPEDRDRVRNEFTKSGGGYFEAQYRIVRPDGSVRWIYDRGFPVHTDGKLSRIAGLATDITERKRAEQALIERARISELEAVAGVALTRDVPLQEMLQECAAAIVTHLDAAFARIWTLSEAGQVLELQASAGQYTHLDGPHGRVPIGKFKIGLIAQERKPHLTNQVIGDPRVGDQEWAKREGMVSFAGYPLVVADRLVGVLAMFARHPLNDFTLAALGAVADHMAVGIERKQAEELIKASLHEKETLLREVHHRVKNNLQIVSSLLSLQTRRITDPALLEVFSSTRNRVRAMASVHEQLYERGDFTGIDLATHLGKLVRMLVGTDAEIVEPVLLLDPVTVDLNVAVPLSLIANELIANALKYAFAGGRKGTLTIGLRTDGAHHELHIADDGPGFPPGVDAGTTTTLGLRLVRDLSRQIRGQVIIDSGRAGTDVVVRWPVRRVEGEAMPL